MPAPNPPCPFCKGVTISNGKHSTKNGDKRSYLCTDCKKKHTEGIDYANHGVKSFELWLNSEKSVAEIAADLGVSKQTLCNRINKEVESMYKEFSATHQMQQSIEQVTNNMLEGILDKIIQENPTISGECLTDALIEQIHNPSSSMKLHMNFLKFLGIVWSINDLMEKNDEQSNEILASFQNKIPGIMHNRTQPVDYDLLRKKIREYLKNEAEKKIKEDAARTTKISQGESPWLGKSFVRLDEN